MILQFLVPVKLLLGVMPSPQLIDAYALHEYTGLTDAIRRGDLQRFDAYLEQYQTQFIQQGVYLLIEKLRLVVLRNLIKKVYVHMRTRMSCGDRLTRGCGIAGTSFGRATSCVSRTFSTRLRSCAARPWPWTRSSASSPT